MSLHILLAGGGTAGHVEPALATADALRQLVPDADIIALGTASGLENRLVPPRGYELRLIPRAPLPRRPTVDLARLPAQLAGAVRAAGRVVNDVRADVVVGFGGYVALPAYLAGRRRRIPLVVHEANARPGLANRVGARLTTYVATATPEVRLRGARYVGMPMRPAVAGLDRPAARASARAALGLDADRPTLLVAGGSQGARRLNQATLAAARGLAAAGIQVLHVAGPEQAAGVAAELAELGSLPSHVVVGYVERMEVAYAAADLFVCRAGAMTCAEVAAVGLPAVYVPLPIGNGEQRLNATPVVRAGGGLLVDDAQWTGDRLLATVVPLLRAPQRLAEMGAAAARFGRRDGDVALARLVLEAAGHA